MKVKNELKNCVHCGSVLGLDSGEAEPDFSDKFCSSGCFFAHLRNIYDATTPEGDKKWLILIILGSRLVSIVKISLIQMNPIPRISSEMKPVLGFVPLGVIISGYIHNTEGDKKWL